jgi:hypothetical protein
MEELSMKMRFKLLPIAALAVVAAVAVTTVTLGLFAVQTPAATNTITLGTVSVSVNEGEDWPEGGQAQEIALNGTLPKAPTVVNEGTVPVWVRVTVAGLENFDTEFTDSDSESNIDEYNTTDWLKVDDIFYYKFPLEKNGTTSAIFTRVKLINASGGLDIIVFAEAVQADWVLKSSGSSVEYAGNAIDAFAALR